MSAPATRRCPRCRRALPLDGAHFHRNRTCPGGFAYRCKDCLRDPLAPRRLPKGTGRRAYELRLAGLPWSAVAAQLGLPDGVSASHRAQRYRRQHALPGFRAARPGSRTAPTQEEG